MEEVTALLEDEEALRFEEEINRNPYILNSWLEYLKFRKDGRPRSRYLIYERALKHLPRSYKLWRAYLQERTIQLKGRCVTDTRYEILVNTYERALEHTNKMPRIWLDYCELLMALKRGTLTRRTFDRALQALPITQHDRVWTLYLEWVETFGVNETALVVYRRYLMFDPQYRETFVNFLTKIGYYQEAAAQLAICVNDENFISPQGHSKHQLWMRLCDMCSQHPLETSRSLKVEAIIRSGIARFSDEVGRLWCRLADFFIRQGNFERARDIYEEAVNSVMTVRDFTSVFDTYAQFEESVLSAKMAALEEDDDEEGENNESDDDLDEDGNDIDLRLARLEHLMERRPLLLSSVLLRQNPHNVSEWTKRVALYKEREDAGKTIRCYTEAVKTVDPRNPSCTGKPQKLWLSFAAFYEEHRDVSSARTILGKAVEVPFRHVDDLADVWCAWGEMELRLAEAATAAAENFDEKKRKVEGGSGDEDEDEFDTAEDASAAADAGYQAALEVMQRAVAEPTFDTDRDSVQRRVHKSVKVWKLYLDLEESLGTVATTRAAYSRMLELRIATPALVLNFAVFLEENQYYEEAFTVYEKGIGVFRWPHVKPIWHQYLDKFLERYGGTKLERARELFEQAVSRVPEKDAAELFLKYSKLEENFGLVRHAMAVYDRATKAVSDSQRLSMYRLYIKKAESFYGVTRTREIHEQAIKVLSDKDAQSISLDYAMLEKKLGEVDRARAIFAHGAQFDNPKRCPDYWQAWQDFEVAHGNEDTFRDMLRIKRSVVTAFANETFYDMAADVAAAEASVRSDADAARDDAMRQGLDPMASAEASMNNGDNAGVKRKASEGGATETELEALERQASRITNAKAQAAAAVPKLTNNPEEIDLDEDEDDEDADEEGEEGVLRDGDMVITERSVPSAVFGDLAEQVKGGEKDDRDGAEPAKIVGALERFKSRS